MVNKTYIEQILSLLGDLLGDDSAMDRRKRNTADSPIFYKDIFPEYPPGLRMREDVAEFVSLTTFMNIYI